MKVKDKCTDCKYFSRRGAIRAHILESHPEMDLGIINESEENAKTMSKHPVKTEISKTDMKTEERICHICKVCVPKSRFINHFKESHPEKDIFKCETCGYECIFHSRFLEHISEAHKEKTTCSYCQKKIKNIKMHL